MKAAEGIQFFFPAELGLFDGLFQDIDGLVVNGAVHGIGIPVLAPVGETELGGVLVAGARSVGQLGDQGEGADGLGPHAWDGQDCLKIGGLPFVGF